MIGPLLRDELHNGTLTSLWQQRLLQFGDLLGGRQDGCAPLTVLPELCFDGYDVGFHPLFTAGTMKNK
uniref:Secreted protein n=1 Tax=Steinernema glaseri TaxID=37863 RepID=A0A1I7ZH36_9BILA